MIVFQVLSFDPVTEILKTRCHIYILMKIVIILRKIHVKMKSFAQHRKKLNIFTPQLPICYIQYQNRMPDAANVGVLRKKRFSQNSKETPVPEETPANFAKFLRTPFLQNNSGPLLLKVDIAITMREIYIVFAVESWMQCLLLWLKSQSTREKSHHPAFMGICLIISHTYQSYLPDR